MLSQASDKRDGESLVKTDVIIRIFNGIHKGRILRIIDRQSLIVIELLPHY